MSQFEKILGAIVASTSAIAVTAYLFGRKKRTKGGPRSSKELLLRRANSTYHEDWYRLK
jgi:hypothetical protein